MKLNIGSGQVKGSAYEHGWTCVDDAYTPGLEEWRDCTYLKFDLKGGTWPIPANSVECIMASHILEHIEYKHQRRVMEEAYRVLMPGAPMRIICPDPRIFIRNWRAQNKVFIMDCYGPDNWKRNGYGESTSKGFTDMFFEDNYDHVVVPSIDMVTIMMIRAGFSKVTEMSFTNTEFPQFFGDYNFSLDNRPVMSWYLEGVK